MDPAADADLFVPGDGRYLVQPIHIDDLAHICLGAAHGLSDVIMDAAGPDTMSFEELVRAIRQAVGRRTPILHASRPAMAVLACARHCGARRSPHPEEIRGLTCGLLASRQPALGQVSFIEWLKESGPALGRGYASELDRHFRTRKTWFLRETGVA